MKEDRIDLLVERLQGTFPTSKISPKAVIGTWRRDEFLQSFPDELGLALRERLQENCQDFPTLREVKFHAKRLLPRQVVEGSCQRCDGNGWVPEMAGDVPVFRPSAGSKAKDKDAVLMWQRSPDQPPEPILYQHVVPCRCSRD